MPFTRLKVDLINFSPKYVPCVKVCKCVYHNSTLISSVLRSALLSLPEGPVSARKTVTSSPSAAVPTEVDWNNCQSWHIKDLSSISQPWEKATCSDAFLKYFVSFPRMPSFKIYINIYILIQITQLFFHNSRMAVVLRIKNIDPRTIPLILGNRMELTLYIASYKLKKRYTK